MADGLHARPLPVAHVIRGRLAEGRDCEHPTAGLVTPKLVLDDLVWPRAEAFPAVDLSLDEVLQFLGATGQALDLGANAHLQRALESLSVVNPLGLVTLRRHMGAVGRLFDPTLLRFEYEQSLGAWPEGWHDVTYPDGTIFQRRWFPTRTVHVLARNLPEASVFAFVRTALTRGVALLKLPSNDPFTAVAILRTMADLDPDHPVTRSFSAVYWRGGDADVESVLFRPQFFDKLIAWGGAGTIKNAAAYVGPGFELVSFDPKTAISMVGREAFRDQPTTARVATAAADDVQYQAACSSSRIQYVEGTEAEVDAYCEELLGALNRYHERMGGTCEPTPSEIVDEVDALRRLEPWYRVWGAYDGTGLVVRSDEPVGFYPEARTVNVVRLDNIEDALEHVNVATQTVGVYPPAHKVRFRDALAQRGADRIIDLGGTTAAQGGNLGRPHDGMIPLHRFPRWLYSQP